MQTPIFYIAAYELSTKGKSETMTAIGLQDEINEFRGSFSSTYLEVLLSVSARQYCLI